MGHPRSKLTVGRAMAESLPRALHRGSRVILALGIGGAASLAAAHGRDELAARLWGAASAERAASGFANMPADQRLLAVHQEQSRNRCGADSWSAAHEAGQRLGVADAVALALELGTGSPDDHVDAAAGRPGAAV